MDVYGLSTPDLFRIDDLLDFTNEDLFSSSTTDSNLHAHHHHFPPAEYPSSSSSSAAATDAPVPSLSTAFTDDLCVPSDDVAELEWLSKFVDDSFSDFPTNELTGTVAFQYDASFPGRARSKRSRAISTTRLWTSSSEHEAPPIGKSENTSIKLNTLKNKTSSSSAEISGDRLSSSSSSPPVGVRRCTHCGSDKTPQWRTGPLGPKTLCNACGVRYKSGRLVPEYRPAASPTFVLTQHSNSHRKVMELRRQKESVLRKKEEQMQQIDQLYLHHHDFEVC